tara:strand:+ start:1006 stop:1383 length:378 start_codon:yes stop_codon:yes gene_type:complete
MKIKNARTLAALEGLALLALVLALYFVLAGCTPVQGFAYVNDSDGLRPGITASQARQAAAVAEAEAAALRAIADENDAAVSRVLGAVTDATSGIETGILGAVLGGAATLFVPPPGTRRKREEAKP